MKKILSQAKVSSMAIALTDDQRRNQILATIAQLLLKNANEILIENKKDLDKIEDENPKKDRLLLSVERLQDISNSIHQVIDLPSPTGNILIEKTLKNGLDLKKIAVPFGVIGVIYESRPNVTIDVAVLNIKSGNATILRGSSEAYHTNLALLYIIQNALEINNLDKNIVQLMPVERSLMKDLLEAEKYVDLLIPRGSQELINFVRQNSKIPVIETGAGVCHTYVEKSANLKKAAAIITNAKIQRPSVCNALDTIIVDKDIAKPLIESIFKEFAENKVIIFADDFAYKILKEINYPLLEKAQNENFGKEYLSLQCAFKTVENFQEAINHIQNFSSKHSECIVTENAQLAESFLQIIDAAAVYHNASTRFTDGEVFGLGAEIGISTQKLHARGPFALEKLVTEKWIIRGNGQIR